MAQAIPPQTLEIHDDHRISSSDLRSSSPNPASSSRLNAGAPEFVPRSAPQNRASAHHPRPARIVYQQYPIPQIVSSSSNQVLDQFEEHEDVQAPIETDPASNLLEGKGLSEGVTFKIRRQVEYYFSDVNLATTEQLMRFISKDPEGYVPISVVAYFKKIKALVQNNSLLADALRTSSKLVVSGDGMKVKRNQPFTVSDVEELQSRMIVAENLPEDHCYQNLMKLFSVVGSVKTIRTCYPQTPNGTAAAVNRSTKMDMMFSNKVHAFVEYATAEDAERAVAELNDERNWRSGLRVRLLLRCMTKPSAARERKLGHEGDGNGEYDDTPISNQPSEKQLEDRSYSEAANENLGEGGVNDKEGGERRGRGRGRGGRGRGRGQFNNNHHRSSGGVHTIGSPPYSHPILIEQPAVSKQPRGPRMPDGTRGFALGRGKPLTSITSG